MVYLVPYERTLLLQQHGIRQSQVVCVCVSPLPHTPHLCTEWILWHASPHQCVPLCWLSVLFDFTFSCQFFFFLCSLYTFFHVMYYVYFVSPIVCVGTWETKPTQPAKNNEHGRLRSFFSFRLFLAFWFHVIWLCVNHTQTHTQRKRRN